LGRTTKSVSFGPGQRDAGVAQEDGHGSGEARLLLRGRLLLNSEIGKEFQPTSAWLSAERFYSRERPAVKCANRFILLFFGG